MELAGGWWLWIYLLVCNISSVRSPVPLRTSLSNTHWWWSATRDTGIRPSDITLLAAGLESGPQRLPFYLPWRFGETRGTPGGIIKEPNPECTNKILPIFSNKLDANMFDLPWTRQSSRDQLNYLEGNMFSRYLTLKEIYDYLDALATNYRDLVTIEEIGRTFEGRPINLVRLVSISSASHPEVDSWVKDLISRHEFYILPVVNPDGYDYTWTTDRMWRKNRVWHSHAHCRGVDLNRNFDFFFKEPSSSANPCHEKYAGPIPFSEAETRAIRNRTAFLRPKLVAFISMHSYDQLWMVPYGPTLRRPKHYAKMIRMAKVATDAINRSSGKHYSVGSISKLSGLVGGGSIDWAYEALRVKYSFAVELRDTGRSGFLLPPNQIVPTGREMWAAVLAVVEMLVIELTSSTKF